MVDYPGREGRELRKGTSSNGWYDLTWKVERNTRPRNTFDSSIGLRERTRSMTQCEFCGANLPADASFCGKCGNMPRQATQMSNASTLQFGQNLDELPTMSLKSNRDEHEATLLLASRSL